MGITEYDAFGPWVFEISEKHRIPKLFENHIEKQDYDMLIKIPRDIERRKANPDMPLYDYVIGCYDQCIMIYKRENLDVRTIKVDIHNICAIKDFRNLLLGDFQIFTPETTISFKYNTVSEDVINKFTDLIRSKYGIYQSNVAHYSLDKTRIHEIDTIYMNLYNTFKKREPHLNVVALQPVSKLKHSSSPFLKRLYNAVMNNTLTSSLYLTTPYDLILLQRGHLIDRLNFIDYSNTYTYIPFHRIDSISMEPSTLTDELSHLQIKTSQYQFNCLFSNQNDTKNNLLEIFNNQS